jgi:site-specific DNA-methyltransferase (adenine-specific)
MTIRIETGDCLEVLRGMDAAIVNCCVTSPPYFGLRDYGHEGQIGLEPTPDAYVAKMVEVFREVRRVLRDDGTLWLNLGDSYASTGDGSKPQTGLRVQPSNEVSQSRPKMADGLKPKDLIGIPWRVAFALQADGWYLRQDIIWAKPNPMPESVQDRCTKAHEYIFLLSKSARYYYDAKAIAEESVAPDRARGSDEKTPKDATDFLRTRSGLHKANGNTYPTRNRRSVWTVATRPYAEAHFATFPPDLIRPCILAGCPVGGTVLDPFGGSGTTGMVAEEEGRNSVLIELNPEYVKLARRRTAQMGLLCGATP